MRYVGLYNRETMEPPRVANIIWAYDFIDDLCSVMQSHPFGLDLDLPRPLRSQDPLESL